MKSSVTVSFELLPSMFVCPVLFSPTASTRVRVCTSPPAVMFSVPVAVFSLPIWIPSIVSSSSGSTFGSLSMPLTVHFEPGPSTFIVPLASSCMPMKPRFDVSCMPELMVSEPVDSKPAPSTSLVPERSVFVVRPARVVEVVRSAFELIVSAESYIDPFWFTVPVPVIVAPGRMMFALIVPLVILIDEVSLT